MKTLEKQYLIEAETKIQALEYRMDYMVSECATEEELRPLYEQWCYLQDYIKQLKAEVLCE